MSEQMKLTKTLKPPIVTPDVMQQAYELSGQLKCPNYNSTTTEFKNLKPSTSTQFGSLEKIKENILDCIGKTPLIKLSNFQKFYNIHFELLGKCEYLNPGGSVKDRIAKEMVNQSEKTKQISKGYTLIEPTSGNTGASLSLVAAVKGYNMIITMPEKMSMEKSNVIVGLGAEVVRTPTEAQWDASNSHINLAYRLEKVLPNACVLDQYKHPGNPLAHYTETAEEIIYQCDGKLDYVVMTAGSCGTIAGISRKIKEKLPNTKIIGVDPYGSILATPDSLNAHNLSEPYMIEGIGYDFVPSVLDRSCIDFWVKTNDEESFCLARDLIRLDGILIGGSSGAALAGVLKAAKHIPPNSRCVVILPDSSRNYTSKFLSNDWMADNKFYPLSMPLYKPYSGIIEDLCPLKTIQSISSTTLCTEAVKFLKPTDIKVCTVTNKAGDIIGVLDLHQLLKLFMQSFLDKTSIQEKTIEPFIQKNFHTLSFSSSIQQAASIIQRCGFCVVKADGQVKGILTAMDLMDHLIR